MNVVNHISDKFFEGNLAAFARFAGVEPAAVWQWKNRNAIRHEHQRHILLESEKIGLGITAADFFPECNQDCIHVEAAQ